MRIEPLEREDRIVYSLEQTCSMCGENVYLQMHKSEYEAWRLYWKYGRFRTDEKRISGFDDTKSTFITKSICPVCQREKLGKSVSDGYFVYASRCRRALMDELSAQIREKKEDALIKTRMSDDDLVMWLTNMSQLTLGEKCVYLCEHGLDDRLCIFEPAETVAPKLDSDKTEPDYERTVTNEFTVEDEAAYYKLIGKLRSSAELIFSDRVNKDQKRMHKIEANGTIDYIDLPDAEMFEQEYPGKSIEAHLITRERTIAKSREASGSYEVSPFGIKDIVDDPIEDWEVLRTRREYRIVYHYEEKGKLIAFVADMSRNPYGTLLAFFIPLSQMRKHGDTPVQMLSRKANAKEPFNVSELQLNEWFVLKEENSKRKMREAAKKEPMIITNRFQIMNEAAFWTTVEKLFSDKPIRHSVWTGPDGKIYHKLECEGELKCRMNPSVQSAYADCINKCKSKDVQVFLPKVHMTEETGNQYKERLCGWKKTDTKVEDFSNDYRVYLCEENEHHFDLYATDSIVSEYGDLLGIFIGLYFNLEQGTQIFLEQHSRNKDISVEITDTGIFTTVTNKRKLPKA